MVDLVLKYFLKLFKNENCKADKKESVGMKFVHLYTNPHTQKKKMNNLPSSLVDTLLKESYQK